MKRFFSILIALLTLGLIIIVHESGHFIACKLNDVPVIRFSIGFGPVLLSKVIGGTEFALSALPFGGYVAMNSDVLATKPFLVKMIILLAGITFNIICACLIIMLLMFLTDKHTHSFINNIKEGFISSWNLLTASARAIVGLTTKAGRDRLSGPLGAIATTSTILQKDIYAYLFMFAAINMQIALFNLLPVPFFDGGQIAHVIIEAISGGSIPSHIMALINILFLVAFILVVVQLTQRDIARIKNETT